MHAFVSQHTHTMHLQVFGVGGSRDFGADLGDAGSGWSRGGAREVRVFVSTAMGESAGCRFDRASTRDSGQRSPLHPTSTGLGWGGGGGGVPEKTHKGFRNLEGVACAP
jgi:hypothetical protein